MKLKNIQSINHSVLPKGRSFTANSAFSTLPSSQRVLFVSPYIPFTIMLSIISYFLLPRTFLPFTISPRASFSRQLLLSQCSNQFIFLFFFNFSIILPSPTLSSTTALFYFSKSWVVPEKTAKNIQKMWFLVIKTTNCSPCHLYTFYSWKMFEIFVIHS